MRVPLAGPCQRRSRRQAAPTSRGLPGTVLAFPARPAAAPPFPTPPGRTRDRSRQPGRPQGVRAACACGLGGGSPASAAASSPALGDGLEPADSSTTCGRSLVLCFHVTLSEPGRGASLLSQSAPTTTQASRAAPRPGGRRLGGGGARGVAPPGPAHRWFPPPGASRRRRRRRGPESDWSQRADGGRWAAGCARRAGCWAAHLPALRPRRPRTWWPPARWAAGWARCSRSCWSWWTCSTKVSPALPRGGLGTGAGVLVPAGSGAPGREAGRRGWPNGRRPGPSRAEGAGRAARPGRRPGAQPGGAARRPGGEQG